VLDVTAGERELDLNLLIVLGEVSEGLEGFIVGDSR
jgi:hypothetical protein